MRRQELERIRAAYAELLTWQRRLTLTPGLVAWLWDDEDRLRERARDAVAMWHKTEGISNLQPSGLFSYTRLLQ
jgi:hypothetical protein